MLKRLLAFVLIFSWMTLSGFDVIEDLNLPDEIRIQSMSAKSLFRGDGRSARLVRNIVESADHPRNRLLTLLEQSFDTTPTFTASLFRRISKLHKVHRVFLI